MAEDKVGPVTKEMVYNLAKSVEAKLPQMTNDMREIKAIIGRIEGHFRRMGD